MNNPKQRGHSPVNFPIIRGKTNRLSHQKGILKAYCKKCPRSKLVKTSYSLRLSNMYPWHDPADPEIVTKCKLSHIRGKRKYISQHKGNSRVHCERCFKTIT